MNVVVSRIENLRSNKKIKMEHYVCKGNCETVSETAGVCTTEDCAMNGQNLAMCKCEDGEHQSEESPIE